VYRRGGRRGQTRRRRRRHPEPCTPGANKRVGRRHRLSGRGGIVVTTD
jgi:hypothetical protein